jgi:probable rRNA maturation factor
MNISVVGKTYNVDKYIVEEVAKAAFSYLGVAAIEGEIELKFVSRAEIKRLNNVYRGIDAETDVLSFCINESPLVGQVFICYTYTKSSAREQNKDFVQEIALLVVHGILHIFGYDHANIEDETKMQASERIILNKEGYLL